MSVPTLPPMPDPHLGYEGNWLSSFSSAAWRLGQLEATSHHDAGTFSHVGVAGSWGQSLWANDCGGGKREVSQEQGSLLPVTISFSFKSERVHR